MELADQSRRDDLIRQIEDELYSIDDTEYWRYVFGRICGRHVSTDTTSLSSG